MAVTDSDRFGEISADTTRAFAEVDRYLEGRGVGLIVGHVGSHVPNSGASSGFDCLLRVYPADDRRSGPVIVIMGAPKLTPFSERKPIAVSELSRRLGSSPQFESSV
jgi:hypothetical protein